MNQLKIFENPRFGKVRTIHEGETVLFCGSDVAKALGYKRPNEAIASHAKGTVKRRTPTTGGSQEMNFIPEGDIYRLVIKSQLPSADEFERWIFEEVLPSIRKHGSYSRPMSQAEILAGMAQLNVEMERKVAALEVKAENTESRLTAVLDALVTLTPESWKEEMNRIINDMCQDNSLSCLAFRGELYGELERVAGCDLFARQSRLRERMKQGGATYKEREAVSKIDIIGRDKKLRAIFEGIVRGVQAQYAKDSGV